MCVVRGGIALRAYLGPDSVRSGIITRTRDDDWGLGLLFLPRVFITRTRRFVCRGVASLVCRRGWDGFVRYCGSMVRARFIYLGVLKCFSSFDVYECAWLLREKYSLSF